MLQLNHAFRLFDNSGLTREARLAILREKLPRIRNSGYRYVPDCPEYLELFNEDTGTKTLVLGALREVGLDYPKCIEELLTIDTFHQAIQQHVTQVKLSHEFGTPGSIHTVLNDDPIAWDANPQFEIVLRTQQYWHNSLGEVVQLHRPLPSYYEHAVSLAHEVLHVLLVTELGIPLDFYGGWHYYLEQEVAVTSELFAQENFDIILPYILRAVAAQAQEA